MKYDFTLKLFGFALNNITKKGINNKEISKKIKQEYKDIMLRASDIGNKNNLISSYALAGYFIAMNRYSSFDVDKNFEILKEGMQTSKLLKMMMGDSKSYFSEKHMEHRRKWSEETHKHIYKNDWVVNVIPGDGVHEFGFDYLECGVCKLCRDEKCPELAKYLCKLDFMLVELIGIHLDRTQTLAEGADKCDFRFRK